MYSALDVAKNILSIAKKNDAMCTPLKLQKLLYYSQGWYLAQTEQLLFEDDIQAWGHGPVCPSVYHHYKTYEWSPINTESLTTPIIKDEILSFLNKIWSAYGQYSGKALEEMTHIESPWKNTHDGSRNKKINIDLIKSHFKKLL